MNTFSYNHLCDERHFFKIEDLSDEEFANMDIGIFIFANLRRYVSQIIQATGPLTEAEQVDLPGTFCDQGYTALLKQKEKALDKSPDERAEMMLRYLKAIANTRVVAAIWKNGQDIDVSFIAGDDEVAVLYEGDSRGDDDGSNAYWHIRETYQDTLSGDPSENLMFAAEAVMSEGGEVEDYETMTNQERLEQIRCMLQPGQYATMKQLVDSDFALKVKDIAAQSGCSVRKVYARMMSYRKKVYANLSPEQQKDPEIIAALKRRPNR